jgi:hypothetical protein
MADKVLKQRACHLRRRYGMTPEDYDVMFKEQGGLCAICGNPPGNTKLHVDHNHKTGEVRGLLCFHCNKRTGFLDDNPSLALTIYEYLLRGTGFKAPPPVDWDVARKKIASLLGCSFEKTKQGFQKFFSNEWLVGAVKCRTRESYDQRGTSRFLKATDAAFKKREYPGHLRVAVFVPPEDVDLKDAFVVLRLSDFADWFGGKRG